MAASDSDLVASVPPPVDARVDTAVVGGGVIGLSVAWELAQRGYGVTVIERRATPAESPLPDGVTTTEACTSWTAAGILPPANFELATDPLDRFRGFSHQIWPDWAARLKTVSGIDVGLIACGGYYLAETAGEAAAMIGMTSYWDELNIECHALSRDQLSARLPDLTSWIESNPWLCKHPDRAAWWIPDEYQVRPPRLLQALHLACRASGVQFIENTSVTSIEHAPSSATIYASDDQSSNIKVATAKRVVLCGGAATGLIDPTIGLQNSFIPIRGQVLLLRSDAFRAPVVVNIGNRYLVSRGDGQVLVGSCEEEAGFAQHATAAMIEQLRQFASHVCPELAAAPEIYRWAGLRPMTFDGFPMLGRVPDRSNLYVAAGHYRSGIHFSPATAIAMADIVDQRPSFIDLSPFAVSLSLRSAS
ncbi:NAD(P)/FAD-dependent oxidoreductase [Allorhodopirellula heiligendammensis]|uniref:Hydrogen cyanide synthase subunit HcnC n=1 Tax=Allorhodopirellula heiligendammensis TaxID=2714739 RepID=A0A5C6BWZ1_9BACT|nr:FAD-dependent oxidoreductase [Allorhodopirellula heiligendammensis]TWU15796.1 Hydrogen cyanide synthase subunit HcnC precursor [Allorhodopirellula heiligendammensis]